MSPATEDASRLSLDLNGTGEVGLRGAVALREPVPVDTHDVIHGLEAIAAARWSAAEERAVAV